MKTLDFSCYMDQGNKAIQIFIGGQNALNPKVMTGPHYMTI